jgi:hypothetical protein
MMVGDERAGRSVACPKCHARVDVPGQRRDAIKKVNAPSVEPALSVNVEAPSETKLSQAPPAPLAKAKPPTPPPVPANDDFGESYTIETLPSKPISTHIAPASTADDLDVSYTIETLPPAPPPAKDAVETAPITAVPSPIPAPPPPIPPKAAASAPPPAPLSHRRGYQADPEKLTAAYVLAMLVAVLGLVTIAPGVYDVVRHLSDPDGEAIGRWTFVVFFLGLVHFAYAIYLAQIPDWSAAWVLTGATLLQGAFYAALLTALFVAGGQSEMVESLDLAPYVDNGRARAWCFVMLCLTGMAGYFCGTVSIRWRRAFVLIREARR